MSGLRLSQLQRLGPCIVCGKQQLAGALPLFYVVEISRAGFDGAAVQRAAGLEMQIGALASVMGPDEALAKVIDGPHRVFVHESCASDIGHLLTLIPTEERGKQAAE